MTKKSLVSYYNLYFNGEMQDLMEIRKKYYKPEEFVRQCLTDALEYAVRFGRKYTKKEDLLNEIKKIKYQLLQALEVQEQMKARKEKAILFKLKKLFHIKEKQRFLIEVSKDREVNFDTIEECIIRNYNEKEQIFYSLRLRRLIKNILCLNIKDSIACLEILKKNLDN